MTDTPTLPCAADHHELSRRKWDGSARAFFEIHYVHWNDLERKMVGWFRIAHSVPSSGTAEVTVQGTIVDRDEPARDRLVRQVFPAEQVRWTDDTTGLEVGGNGLRRGRWWGDVADGGSSLRWDFRADPGEVAVRHLPPTLYRGAFPPTKIHAPHFRASFSGLVEVDGRPISVMSAIGNSSHYWGRQVIQDRTWVSCQIFREDPDFGFEGVSGRAAVGRWLLPRVTYLCFLWEGRLYNLNGMVRSLLNGGRHELRSWEFVGRSGSYRFVGRATGRPERMIAHRLASPDGRTDRDQVVHTDFTGDLVIRIERRGRTGWKTVKTLTADRTAAFETSRRHHDPRVRRVAF